MRRHPHRSTWVLLLCVAVGPVAVQRPDGSPAAGASAVLVPPGRSATVTDGRTFDDDPAFVRATADAAGRLAFAPAPAGSLLVVIADAGYAVADADHPAGPVRLTAWAGLRGRRLVRGRPAADRAVVVWCDPAEAGEYDPGKPSALFMTTARTDAAGRYVVDRVPAAAAVDVAASDPVGWTSSPSRPLFTVATAAGRTADFDVAGHGRAVAGQVTPPAGRAGVTYAMCMAEPVRPPVGSPVPPDISAAPLSRQAAWWATFDRTPAAAAIRADDDRWIHTIWAHTYFFDVRPDGSFTLEDVEPGTYGLWMEAQTGPADHPVKVGQVDAPFTVPPGDGPVTLPPFAVRPTSGLRVGDVAPDFTVPGLDDRPVRLGDYRGKYVLIDFWATWCGPCVAELPNVRAVADRHRADNRLVVLGLSQDHTPDKPLAYAAAHGLRWRQAFLGFGRPPGGAADLYDVDGIPSIWLIGPDGRVLARDLRDARIGETVAAALGR